MLIEYYMNVTNIKNIIRFVTVYFKISKNIIKDKYYQKHIALKIYIKIFKTNCKN